MMSLPVITIGAAYTALLSCVFDLLPVVVLFWIACPSMASGWMLKRILEKIYPELFMKKEEE